MVGRQLSAAGARVPRSAIIVIGCLLLGLAAGALISSVALARKSPRVSDADYALMVANLFDHEKSVFNARERLATLGKNPVEVVGGALESYAREHPEDRRGIEQLRQLDQGLRQAEADASSQRAATSPGLVGVVGLILASVLVAVGAAWVWKVLETRGVRLPSLAPPRDRDARPIGARGGFASALATVVGRRRGAIEEIDEPEDDLDLPPRRPTRLRRGRLDMLETPPPLTGDRSRRRPSAPAPPPVEIDEEPEAAPDRRVFKASYTVGEETYDQVHPIVDDRGELIGACGLSATEHSDRPGRFYGFTGWLQDYGHPNELSAVGLVTRSGLIARSAAIAEWRRRGTIDDVHAVERGVRLGLRTSRIDALLTMDDFDYIPGAHGSPGYFARLTIRLEVGPAF
jgi:hypothetical protein